METRNLSYSRNYYRQVNGYRKSWKRKSKNYKIKRKKKLQNLHKPLKSHKVMLILQKKNNL